MRARLLDRGGDQRSRHTDAPVPDADEEARPEPDVVVLVATGCEHQRSESEFIPANDECRVALTAALDAWKAGQPAGPVAGTVPLIHVTDSSRISGQTLKSWEILGEVPGNAQRCYAVRLVLENPIEERRERFVLVGIDPMWIFRHEDYDLLRHWEHQMPKESGPDAVSKDSEPSLPADKKSESKSP